MQILLFGEKNKSVLGFTIKLPQDFVSQLPTEFWIFGELPTSTLVQLGLPLQKQDRGLEDAGDGEQRRPRRRRGRRGRPVARSFQDETAQVTLSDTK